MDFTSGNTSAQHANEGVEEQRSAPRFTSLIRAAKLVCEKGEFVCVIRDVSATGVSLRTFHALPDGSALSLQLQNGESYSLTPVRKNGLDASFQFTSPVDVDRLISENWQFPKRQLRLNISMPVTVGTLTHKTKGMITNVSQQGGRLECDSVFAIDQTIRIESEFGPEVRCKVRWRRDSSYGLAYDSFVSLREFAILAARIQAPELIQTD